MDYVQFELPASSEGTLYYNYTGNGSYDSRVTEGRSYYRSSSPYLRRVTFVADRDFSGTAEIDFNAWDTKETGLPVLWRWPLAGAAKEISAIPSIKMEKSHWMTTISTRCAVN